jgi:benzoyl-CoA-dihydrodiol lyase
LKFLAAINGSCAGGGYELALACDEIVLIDDRSTTVSLPEVPLLGVLPGTGGLTRLVDKRKMRRDLADLFCTRPEGVRADRAKEWRLVDDIAPPNRFAAAVQRRALALAAQSTRDARATAVPLPPLTRAIDAEGYRYRWVEVRFDRAARHATLTVKAPPADQPLELGAILDAGAQWWPLAMARELDDAILMLRLNELELGTLLLKTEGAPDAVLAADRAMLAHRTNWFVRETIGFLRRTLARLDVTARSLFAVIDRGSCFAGTLMELALACDRSYMLAPAEGVAPSIALSPANFGIFPMVNGLTRLETRFCGEAAPVAAAASRQGQLLDAPAAMELGLVTQAPDELDWEDELRLALEERASLSPDALTGLEANLRFAGPETMATRIFARLSAWQNWIFTRPNATGPDGALHRFGTGTRPRFDRERV